MSKVSVILPLEETLRHNRFCMKLISDRYRSGAPVPKHMQEAYYKMMAFEAEHTKEKKKCES